MKMNALSKGNRAGHQVALPAPVRDPTLALGLCWV